MNHLYVVRQTDVVNVSGQSRALAASAVIGVRLCPTSAIALAKKRAAEMVAQLDLSLAVFDERMQAFGIYVNSTTDPVDGIETDDIWPCLMAVIAVEIVADIDPRLHCLTIST